MADDKVGDHHAIIPTNSTHNLDKLSDDDRRIYDLVARRFLAVFHPEAVFENTKVETTVASHVFRTRGKVLLVPGWRGVYGELAEASSATDDDEGRDQQLPKLERSETVQTRDVSAAEKETQPPRRYSDASLLGAMETAGRLVDDDEMREAMKESGIGTPATRASIIERLIDVGYVEREARSLVATEKGLNVIRLLGEHPLTSPSMTGDWEQRLGMIERGEEPRKTFMADIKGFAESTVAELDAKLKDVRIPRANLGPCPVCGHDIVENRKGFSCWSREDPGCGFVIWKAKAGKTLPMAVAKELIATGRTAKPVTGFKGRSGRSFRARLALQQSEEGKWRVEFDEPWAREGGRAHPSRPRLELTRRVRRRGRRSRRVGAAARAPAACAGGRAGGCGWSGSRRGGRCRRRPCCGRRQFDSARRRDGERRRAVRSGCRRRCPPSRAPSARSARCPRPPAPRASTCRSPPLLSGLRLHPGPKAGLAFDLADGRILWRRSATAVRPIASLTKLMTALLAVERFSPRQTVRIPRAADQVGGSRMAGLKPGRRVRAEVLLKGLLISSSNNAAVALAVAGAGSERAWVALMNRRAQLLGLTCTHFADPDGLDRGNRSCPADLAALAMRAMNEPRIRQIARKRYARVWPGSGRKLTLYTTNHLLRDRYPGAIGLKTGFTNPAGFCLVAIIHRGARRIGVVVLGSRDSFADVRRVAREAVRVGALPAA